MLSQSTFSGQARKHKHEVIALLPATQQITAETRATNVNPPNHFACKAANPIFKKRKLRKRKRKTRSTTAIPESPLTFISWRSSVSFFCAFYTPNVCLLFCLRRKKEIDSMSFAQHACPLLSHLIVMRESTIESENEVKRQTSQSTPFLNICWSHHRRYPHIIASIARRGVNKCKRFLSMFASVSAVEKRIWDNTNVSLKLFVEAAFSTPSWTLAGLYGTLPLSQPQQSGH